MTCSHCKFADFYTKNKNLVYEFPIPKETMIKGTCIKFKKDIHDNFTCKDFSQKDVMKSEIYGITNEAP